MSTQSDSYLLKEIGQDNKHGFPAPPITRMNPCLKNIYTGLLFTVNQDLTNIFSKLKRMNASLTLASQTENIKLPQLVISYRSLFVYGQVANLEYFTHLLSTIS